MKSTAHSWTIAAGYLSHLCQLTMNQQALHFELHYVITADLYALSKCVGWPA